MGVPKNADDTQIKNAYRKLALRFHPDKNKVEGSRLITQEPKRYSRRFRTLTPRLLMPRRGLVMIGMGRNRQCRPRGNSTTHSRDSSMRRMMSSSSSSSGSSSEEGLCSTSLNNSIPPIIQATNEPRRVQTETVSPQHQHEVDGALLVPPRAPAPALRV